MRSKKQSLPFDQDDIADAESVSYNDDIILQDKNMNRNAIITARKISDKYKNIYRKRKRQETLNLLRER